MKKTILIIILFFFMGCKQNAQTPNEKVNTEDKLKKDNDIDRKILSLKEFYYSVYGSDDNREYLKKRYVSERVLKRIDSLTSDGDNLILDYDPFIQGQDYNSASIKRTLKIISLNNKDKFRVSFLLFGNKDEKRTNIDVALQKNEKENYLINSILNDEYLNFKDDFSKTEQNKFYVLDSVNLKIQTDVYKICVLEKLKNKNKENIQHNSNPIILYKNGNKITENKNLIFLYNDNCPADGFQKVVSKHNYFTIEQSYCKDFLFVSSYTTFKVDTKTKNVYLYKYGEEYTDRSNPDRDIPAKIKTVEDFGTIKFEDVTAYFLLQLKQ
ncbi:MAG: DUF3828 domain-containing protein [Chryseobacterium sp.]|nr:DUF3828 domain-containing protein [Chryseobacterium sp.]